MKLDQWARLQTYSILKKLVLTVLMILLPSFILMVYWAQYSRIQSLYSANANSLLVAVQTGDLLEIDKILAAYTSDKAVYSYELIDRDNNILKSYSSSKEPQFLFKKKFPILGKGNAIWGTIDVSWTVEWSHFVYFILGTIAFTLAVTVLVYNHWKRFTKTLVGSFEQIRYFFNHEEIPEFIFKIEELRIIFESLQSLHLNKLEAEKLKWQLERERDMVSLSQRVVHDIRSPLSVLSLMFGITSFDGERKILVDAAFKRMDEVCNELLDGRKNLLAQTQNIYEVIQEIASEQQFRFPNKKLNLTLGPNQKIGLFPDVEFKSVLSNLLTNAFEATKPGTGVVSIIAEESANSLKLKITDNGCGIPNEIIHQLGTKPVTYGKGSQGNGLGFYNAKMWSIKNSAEIKIESKIDHGTEISIHFSI